METEIMDNVQEMTEATENVGEIITTAAEETFTNGNNALKTTGKIAGGVFGIGGLIYLGYRGYKKWIKPAWEKHKAKKNGKILDLKNKKAEETAQDPGTDPRDYDTTFTKPEEK